MSALVDPNRLRAAAARLEQQRDLVFGVGRQLSDRVDRTPWHAPPRSEIFRAKAASRRREAESIAHELDQLAADLRRQAQAIEAELAVLRKIERFVRNEIGLALRVGRALPFASPFNPSRLPPPGDPAWRKVGKLFGFR
jgi:hypothetical protein